MCRNLFDENWFFFLTFQPQMNSPDNNYTKRLAAVTAELEKSYRDKGATNDIDGINLPIHSGVIEIIDLYMALIFPGFLNGEKLLKRDLAHEKSKILKDLFDKLSKEVEASVRFGNRKLCKEDCEDMAKKSTVFLLEKLPGIRSLLITDIEAAFYGDPSVNLREEIILCFPGLYAVALYRFAHEFYELGIPLIPRMMTEIAKTKTGIDIHPGAKIGSHFFIDHGTGVVIGETTEIGDCVKIYQNVTLGALSFKKEENGKLQKGVKRHPTIGNKVIIYSGSSILGGKTVIGENSIIGGNVWLTRSVDANRVIVFDAETRLLKESENTDVNNCVPCYEKERAAERV